MGGQAGIRGYLIQGIIAVIDSLNEDDQWETVSIEPNDTCEKVDILWTYANKKRKLVQVKSTQNKFSLAQGKGWAKDLKKGSETDDKCILYLVGELAAALYKKKNTSVEGVLLKHSDLDIDTLIDNGIGRIDRFYESKGKHGVSYGIRKMIAYNLNFDVAVKSIFGTTHNRNEFETALLNYLKSIEESVKLNPLAFLQDPVETSSSGGQSNYLGQNILALFGWQKFNQNENVTEYNERLDKDIKYNVDFFGQFESKLKDDKTDVIYIHSQLLDRYPDNGKSIIENHTKSIHLIREKLGCDKSSKNEQNEHAILFLLSASDSERGDNYVADGKNYYKPSLLNDDLNYYLVDNPRLDFLVASILEAKRFRVDLPVKFMYPITEENSSEKKIGKRGFSLPPQYVCTSILPIIKEDSGKISILLFCKDEFSREGLKKVIWLMIRLTSGLANEYRIYFRGYSNEYQNEVNEVLRFYGDEHLLDKTEVFKLNTANSSGLGAVDSVKTSGVFNDVQYDEKNIQTKAIELNQHLSEYLPYGDQIRPFLSSDSIDSKDLRHFLSGKGVFFKTQNKQRLIYTMSSMLFSPEEIEILVENVSVKERPLDTQSELYHVVTDSKLEELIPKINQAIRSVSLEGLSGNILSDRIEFIPDKTNRDKYVAVISVEEINPTKQAMVSSVLSTARITIDVAKGEMEIEKGSNSRPARAIATRVVKVVSETLTSSGDIEDKVRRILFQDFDNSRRVNFLLSFTNIETAIIFSDQDITFVKYAIDESAEILEEYKDRIGKNLEISSKGKNLSGLKELKIPAFKEIVFVESLSVRYTFEVKGIKGYYRVNLNFSNALKDKSNPDGVFQHKSNTFVFTKFKSKVSSVKALDDELRKAFNTLRREKLMQFKLI